MVQTSKPTQVKRGTYKEVWIRLEGRTFIVRFKGSEWVYVYERILQAKPKVGYAPQYYYNNCRLSRKANPEGPKRGLIAKVLEAARHKFDHNLPS